MSDRAYVLGTLFRKLRSIGHLTDDDRQVLASAPLTTRTYGAGQDILAQGSQPNQSCILLSGWTYRHKTLRDGRTQILGLNVTGDFVDLQSLDLPVMDHSLTALTQSNVACISHQDMRQLLAESRSLTSLLWRSVLIDQAVLREWLLSLGRRGSEERVAHLLCETYTRLHALGLTSTHGNALAFSLPLNQLRLSQVVGLSTVHMNRVLQSLRAQGLIVFRNSVVTFLDWPKLQALAGFDASYLGQGVTSS